MTDQFKPGDKVQVAGKNYTVTSMKMVPVELLPNTVLLSPCEGHGLLKQFPVEVVTRVDPRREEVLDLALTIQASPQLFVWGMRDVANRQNSVTITAQKAYQAGRMFAEMYLAEKSESPIDLEYRATEERMSRQMAEELKAQPLPAHLRFSSPPYGTIPPKQTAVQPSKPPVKQKVVVERCPSWSAARDAGGPAKLPRGTAHAEYGYRILKGSRSKWARSMAEARKIANEWRKAT